MKIIAKTDGGYLVEATADEIAACVGHPRIAHMDDNPKLFEGTGFGKKWRIGVQLLPILGLEFLEKLRREQRLVSENAKMLRSLADMVMGVLPETVLAPVDALEPKVEQ